MITVYEAVKSVVQTFADDEPISPVHVGEVMNCWMYLAILNEAAIYMRVGLNTTTDDELRASLQDSKVQCESQSQRLSSFMQQEGISLPPTSEPKPFAESTAIPLGVKLTDDEIANGISIKTVTSIMACATGAAESIRSDVSLMWTEFLTEKLKYAATLKTMMRKRGWIKVPPLYVPAGTPKH